MLPSILFFGALTATMLAIAPDPGIFVALGAAILCAGSAWAGFRTSQNGRRRLIHASTMTLAVVAITISSARLILGVLAIRKIGSFLT